MAGLNNFTPSGYTQVTAVAAPQVSPLSGSGATALISLVGGTPAIVLPCTPVVSPTATQPTVGSKTIVVNSAASILVGQLVQGAGIQATTTVTGISSTTISISLPTTAILSSTTVNFFTAPALSTGIAVTSAAPLSLGIGSNAYLAYMSHDGGYSNSVMNVVVGT